MSTIPELEPSQDPERSIARPAPKSRRGRASFRYGYREVRKKLPNGEITWKRVPLTLEDVLHPRFGDVHVLSDAHGDDCIYLKDVLKARYADNPSVVVFSDCGIFWDLPELKHHSPDLSVIFGIKERKDWVTFHVAEEHTRPSLIIEVTSRNTRVNDVKTKVEQYARAQVLHYVIADAQGSGKDRRLSFIAYKLEQGIYEPQPLDERGWAWLDSVGLWLGTRLDPLTGGDRVALIDPTTNLEIGDYTAIDRARTQAIEQFSAATEQLNAATKQRDAAVRLAESEAAARAIAEARARDLEARLAQFENKNNP